MIKWDPKDKPSWCCGNRTTHLQEVPKERHLSSNAARCTGVHCFVVMPPRPVLSARDRNCVPGKEFFAEGEHARVRGVWVSWLFGWVEFVGSHSLPIDLIVFLYQTRCCMRVRNRQFPDRCALPWMRRVLKTGFSANMEAATRTIATFSNFTKAAPWSDSS